MELSSMQIFGAWVSIFLTLGVLSFLYEDNPIYKMTEHLYLGVSIGYGVVESYYGIFKPNLIDKLMAHQWVYLFALVLSLMLFFKLSRKYNWIARFPIAFIVASYAAVKMTGEASARLLRQVETTMPNLAATWSQFGFWSWQADGAGVLSDMIIVLGTAACLIHFYFSDAKTTKFTEYASWSAMGAFGLVSIVAAIALSSIDSWLARIVLGLLLGLASSLPFLALSPYKHWISRFGILVLMISFGASFGYTVMGRLSLAIGRGQALLGLDRPLSEVNQIHPRIATIVALLMIVGLIAYWQTKHPNENKETL